MRNETISIRMVVEVAEIAVILVSSLGAWHGSHLSLFAMPRSSGNPTLEIAVEIHISDSASVVLAVDPSWSTPKEVAVLAESQERKEQK